jgi:hypothetical protein
MDMFVGAEPQQTYPCPQCAAWNRDDGFGFGGKVAETKAIIPSLHRATTTSPCKYSSNSQKG